MSINHRVPAARLHRHQLLAISGKAAYALISGVETIDGDVCVTVYENGVPGNAPMYIYRPAEKVEVCRFIAHAPAGTSSGPEEWPPRCTDSLPKTVGSRVRHLDHSPVGRKNPKLPDTGTGRIADYLPDEDLYVVDWDDDAPSTPNPVAWSAMVGCDDPDTGSWGI